MQKQRLRLLFTVVLAATQCISTATGQAQRVTTRLGSLNGWTGLSRSGRDYRAFTKIPYAKPPTGSLRFKNPVEFGAWTGDRDATDDMPFCPQSTMFGQFVGTEDCLYLSVYTPKINPKNKLPVLFYIHGGAFKMGHPGPRDMANYLMDEDVVLVTTTYRVGVMGFLSLEDSSLPGNFGLKDQAMALKWVKSNVDSFGGDPDMITLMGESAGAASVHHLMLSPLTRDLMKGGVSMSGTVNKVWSLAWKEGLIRRRTIDLAKILGCHDIGDTLNCLQRLKLEEIVPAADSVLASEDSIPFKPVVEPRMPGAVIPDDPTKAPSSKPWITSFTNGEFILGSVELNAETEDLTNDDIDNFLNDFLKRRGVLNALDSKVKKLKEKYISGKEFPLQVSKCWANMSFVYPALDNLARHIGPKFAYHLEYKGANSIMDLITAKGSPYAGHADEIIYLFDYSSLLNKLSEDDTKFSKDFIKLIVNFARYQTPGGGGNSSLKWKQWNGKEMMRLTADGFFTADDDFNRDLAKTVALWKDIFSNDVVTTRDEL